MDKKFRIREGIDRRELFGNLDVNLDYIREVTSADIIQRDDELIIKAESEEAIDKASRILDELMGAIDAGEVLDKQKVQYIISLSEEGISYKESRVNKDVICFTHKGKPLKPKTLGQKNYVNSIRNKDIVFGVGPAGTGKTYIAVAMAINAYKNKEVQKIMQGLRLRREKGSASCRATCRIRLTRI